MDTPARRVASFTLIVSVLALARPVTGQPENPLPPSNRAPRLVLAHPGPHAPVTALAFAPDASALYVAGFDKQVRRYRLVKGEYVADGAFRVPIGPWNAGLINALAVSPDGRWLAAAGRAPIRDEVWAGAEDATEADLRFASTEMRGDAGIVYLFDLNKPDNGKAIRGQLSEVRALAFADPAPANGAVLVTTGIEWNEKGERFGALRVFDVSTGKQIADNTALPATTVPPGLAAWATGADKKGLRVGVAWPPEEDKPGNLLVWDDPRGPGAKPTQHGDGKYNSTLAVRIGKDGAVAELITGAYHADKRVGGVTVRGPDGSAKEFVPLTKDKHAYLPLGVEALNIQNAAATAVLSRVISLDGGPVQHELRVISTRHTAATIDGLNPNLTPVLAASRDGRFLAVGGFTDNRVEVHSAAALAAGKPAAPQKLAGATSGFAQVAFLAGEKLWLGQPTDSTEKGGAILDLSAKVRTAAPRGANEALKIDAPAGVKSAETRRPADAERFFAEVAKAVGTEKAIALPAESRVTAVAYLPAKPAWDVNLGPIVAVAYRFERSQGVRLTLYDAVTARALYHLGGPTLPLKALAFSGSRALLAGAGDDGTVAVWSLKNVSRPSPMIEGLIVTTRGNDAVVASVQKDSPASNKLAIGDVIESVKDAKGADRAVKNLPDFLQALRTLKVGDKAQIKVKGKAAVEVAVGTALGFRLPLFELWVDPVAKDGKHAWVGWTSSGPYDASDAGAESRIAWVTATGDPARPVSVAGVEQYRRLFYTRDFIRRLVETADYHLAYVPPTPPEFKVAFPGLTDTRDGRAVTREKLNATVTLADPDRVHDLSRAELRWQVSGPGGASEWLTAPFAGGQATLTLTDREWKRGEYTVTAKLFRSSNAKDTVVPLEQAATAVRYVPPPPELAVKIDGKEPTALDAVTAAKPEEVEVAVVANAPFDPEGAKVTVSYTGGKEIVLPSKPDGTFAPLKLSLTADDVTIQVTATNRGAGADAKEESRSVQGRVRKPVKIPTPEIALEVLTAFDARLSANDPHVVSTPKAMVLARVKATAPLAAFEWKIGTGAWEAGKLDAKTSSQTLELDLNKLQTDHEKGVSVQVRAKTAASEFATSEAVVRYDGLPEVSVDMPKTLVTTPELNLSGGLKVTSKRRFAVRVLVTSSRTGRTREFDPTPNAALTAWDAGITLFPGENQLGYVVRYDENRKELRRAGLVEVRYLRPPVVLGGGLDVGTGASGALSAVVASAAEAPPELLVNGVPVGASTSKKPLRVFGASLWMATAAGVPANPGVGRLKPVSVVARNAEHDGEVADVAVRGAPVKKEIPPPTIDLRYAGGAVTPNRPLPPVGDANFAFDLRVKSDARLTRVEVWQGASPDGKLELLDGVSAAGSVAEGAGFSLTARPTLRLRPGAGNYVRVLAANGGEPVSFGFYATYTPPPVRVEIDSIKEPNGQPVAVTLDNAAKLRVASGVIEVQGRVLWDADDEPVAKDPQLSVVFVANGVAHLPVTVSSARSGERVRKFSGRVYLNAPDPKAPGEAHVHAVLRSGLRAVPQVGNERAAITVTSSAPVTRQRLHVLIVGVEVPEEKQGELVRKVIKAIGGKIPADNPNFTQGRFERDKFEFARLYPPQLGYTRAGHLNKLLDDVRADIERRATKPGDEWVNDVILLYYQGADWKDESGRWLLHTAPTMSGAAGKNAAEYAIRPDALRPVPGMLVGVMNVTGAKLTDDPLSIDLPHLRYAWKDGDGRANLLGAIERAVTEQRTVEEMRKSVDESLAAPAQNEALVRSRFLPHEVLVRVVGLKP